jgi:hypothetical protein
MFLLQIMEDIINTVADTLDAFHRSILSSLNQKNLLNQSIMIETLIIIYASTINWNNWRLFITPFHCEGLTSRGPVEEFNACRDLDLEHLKHHHFITESDIYTLRSYMMRTISYVGIEHFRTLILYALTVTLFVVIFTGKPI